MSSHRPSVTASIILVVRTLSVVLAGAAIIAMALVMLSEAIMRYVFTDPLGWNISAVERLFMPMSVFLALPWLYVTAGHVSAEIIYDRMPAPWRKSARVIGHVLLLLIAAGLTYGGAITAFDSLALGDAPPPGSSEVPIPSWTWQLIQPVGAGALFLVALLDMKRAIGEDGSLERSEDEEEALIAAVSADPTGSATAIAPVERTASPESAASAEGGDRA